MKPALALILLLNPGSTLQGAIILVASGSGAPIQRAINQAQVGDIIEVGPGIYTGNIDFGNKAITLRSTAGPSVTTLNGNQTGTTVRIGGNAEISGFTITGGKAIFGAGMAVAGTGTRIINNIFRANVQEDGGYGAAIGGNAASPFISGNIFTDNSSSSQALSGTVSFVNASSPIIENNLFFNNKGRGLNLTLPRGNSPFVTNNTFWGNTTAIRLDGAVDTSSVTFQNNILGSNNLGFAIDFLSGSNLAAWNNNLLFGNKSNYGGVDYTLGSLTGVNGNIEGNPLFLNPGSGDFRFVTGSPAIDAGRNVGAPMFDFVGNPRFFDGNSDGTAITDIGAFEYIPEPTCGVLIFFSWVLALSRRRRFTCVRDSRS